MIKSDQLVNLIIYPALSSIEHNTIDAVALVAGTCAQESLCGDYIIQSHYKPGDNIGKFKGALGVFQMERRTHDDLVNRFLAAKPHLLAKVKANFETLKAERLIYDLRYAATMARIFYLSKPGKIPSYKDVEALGSYYKKWYNTKYGAATVEQFCLNFEKVKGTVIALESRLFHGQQN